MNKQCLNKPKRLEIHVENLNTPWQEVLHLGVRCQFPKHHVEPGYRERGFYFLRQGSVRLSYVGDSGQERSSLFIGANCLFNEIPALRQGQFTSAFYCLQAVEAWRFEATILENVAFIAEYPHLIANIMQSMARKSSLFFMHLSEMVFSSSMSQICAMLLQLVDSQNPRMTQSELAAVLGLHLTTVARLIRTLRNEGILGRFTKTELEVLDLERLKALAENHRNEDRRCANR